MCGGKSSRMGQDKALLKSGAKTWAEMAADKLSALGMRVVASINARQEGACRKVLGQVPLIIDNTAIQVGGPLLGLLSVHAAHPKEDLFVLACDLPLMDQEVLALLHDLYSDKTGFQAYVFTLDGEPEPMCGIYTGAALAKVLDLLQTNRLVRQSLKYVLGQLTVEARAVPEDKRRCFINVNNPTELQYLIL